MPPEILDVGCNKVRAPEATCGIDYRAFPGVDIVHDLERFPWPIADNRFDVILCRDVIEHLNDVVRTMEELHRIAKPGGRIKIWTPHFAHPNSFRDPTHRHHFSLGTFDYFTGDIAYPRYSERRFAMRRREFIFRKPYALGRIIARVSERWYEKHYAHRSPPHGLYFELEVVK